MRIKLTIAALAFTAIANAQQRQMLTLTEGWQFSRDNASWKSVNIPHDWAIAGPFDKKWDLQYVAIEQNGEKEKSEKSGRSGALPWIGEGHYRTSVTLPQGYTNATLMVDGAMSNAHVRVNGKELAYWPYGYNAFNVNIPLTPEISTLNIEIDLNNVEESSRWYPGGGLYRPVRLLLNGDTRFEPWQTYIRTIDATEKQATLEVKAKVIGKQGKTAALLADAEGRIVASASVPPTKDGNMMMRLWFDNPKLWSPESPYLYTLTMNQYADGKLLDTESHKVGIRTISVTKEGGFQLNGKSRKIKGVCLHHDLGPLGAAENKAALIRQIKTMKAMGCDAIRTAHNMPSTMQMDICDSLGMMVMAESFDMWIYPKCKNGYAKFFKEWSDRDIENLVLHHRNHPSIIMWSIGNEIPEQWSEEGVKISRHLQDICHRLDPSRTVTQGMDRAEAALKSGFAQVMDVPGFNYRVHLYDNNIRQLPKGFLLGSETASTVSSRGVYKFPVEVSNTKTYSDGQCSGYDVEYCSWSNLPDDDWRMQDDRDYTIGEFVWTGYDYLGEPTPYDEYWPSRSSYFGICDLAGLPKDRFWLYRSRWRTDAPTLHVLPHWTWPGREGEVTPVYCYTSYPSAELFVNGKSQGRKVKNPATRLDRYRLRWNDVVYEPGEIKVVAYDYDGRAAATETIRTAAQPARIVLKADRATIASKGEDLSFVTVSLVDKDGNPCPAASNNMTFKVTGAGKLRGACNGDATSLVPFCSTSMPLFSGALVVVVEGTAHGSATLSVTADGLPEATQTITVD